MHIMMEAAVVVDRNGEPIHWHLPDNRSGGALPDSTDLWSVIWENRDRIAGIAHTHPGGGHPSPSHEDVTTFSAVEKALGRRLQWWIATSNRLSIVTFTGPGDYAYAVMGLNDEPSWLGRLRELSEYTKGV